MTDNLERLLRNLGHKQGYTSSLRPSPASNKDLQSFGFRPHNHLTATNSKTLSSRAPKMTKAKGLHKPSKSFVANKKAIGPKWLAKAGTATCLSSPAPKTRRNPSQINIMYGVLSPQAGNPQSFFSRRNFIEKPPNPMLKIRQIKSNLISSNSKMGSTQTVRETGSFCQGKHATLNREQGC